MTLSHEILEKTEKSFSDEGWGLWKIILKDQNKYLGYVGLWQFFDDTQPQLLYAIKNNFSLCTYETEGHVCSRNLYEEH